MSVAVGCCGFTRSRAEYYRSFRLVEVQQSFYRLPRVKTARRWREEAPPGFQFTLKAWQSTASLARVLASRVVLFQCPASFRECSEHVANLRSFFRNLPRGDFLLAWEPRGPWKDHTVQGLCRELDLLHCVDPLVRAPLWGSPLYLRLHGGPGYWHRYTREELERVQALIGGRPAYVLFNNLDRFQDALAFLRLLQPEPEADGHP